MGIIEQADLFILDKLYQRFADWVNDTYEVSSFALAYLCYGTWSAVGLSVSILVYINHLGDELSRITLPFFVLSAVVYPAIRIYFIRKEERRLQSKLNEAIHFNRYRLDKSWRSTRLLAFGLAFNHTLGNMLFFILLLGGGVPSTIIWYGMSLQAFIWAFGSAEYFAACTPKPPKPKKEKLYAGYALSHLGAFEGGGLS